MWLLKKLIQRDIDMSPLRFQTCRLLSGNVRNRELTIIQRRILRRLRNRKRSIKKRKIYPKKYLTSYIQLQTTRKLPLFHGDLPITEMHRGTKRTSQLLNQLLQTQLKNVLHEIQCYVLDYDHIFLVVDELPTSGIEGCRQSFLRPTWSWKSWIWSL